MGITNFHKWLRETYKPCIKDKWLDYYDNVYIDLNFVLHYCYYGSKTQDEIYEKLFVFIKDILELTQPTKTVVFAADGSASLSKLLLQRKRRLQMSVLMTKQNNNDINMSSTIFSPATTFMKNLEKNLQNLITFIENIYNVKIINLIDNVDEAELKLKKIMMDNINANKDDTHIIISNDADVVIMLSTLKNYQNTFIFNKNPKTLEIISINKLLSLHKQIYKTAKHPNLDFSAINMFMGNDYIPKLSCITFEKLWSSYKATLLIYKNGLIELNKDIIVINNNFVEYLLMTLIIKTKKYYLNKTNLENFSNKCSSNYIDGYTWCLTTYMTGICDRYNYMYKYKSSPQLLQLLLNIKLFPEILLKRPILYPAINNELYSMLILPFKYIDLIDSKNKKFVEKYPVLYEEENCNICVSDNKHRKTHNNLTLKIIDSIIYTYGH